VSNYAVGVFRDGQLHLTPVTSVLQMRPTMSHLDDDDGDDDHDMEAHPAPSSSNVVAAAAAEEVQVQVVKRQSERALAAMQNSYAYKRSVVQSEKWTDLSINANEDDEFEQLFSDVETPVVFDVTPQAYLHALSYRQDDNVIAVSDVDPTLLHFNRLCEYLPDVPPLDIRAALPRVASIVRGCVVVNSTLLKDHVEYRAAIVSEVHIYTYIYH
ncbi:hypothetical protein DYB28_002462, partial [Aphanomyces astaci]